MGTQILKRYVKTGRKASAHAIQRARAYAMTYDAMPSESTIAKAAHNLGVDTYLLCGIIYAQVTLNNQKKGE